MKNDNNSAKPAIFIGDRPIGRGHPVFIIAEMSANHSKSLEHACQLIHAAKEAGADAVKVQTYTPDTLTLDSKKKYFMIQGGTLWDGRSLYDLFQEAYMPWEWYPKLQEAADVCGILLFSTAFDPSSVDFLEQMNVPVHKVASFEIVDIPLIEKMASTSKPLILSTGMANWEEIETAVAAAKHAGAKQIALLKCTSSYPAPARSMNLRAIPRMEERFGTPVGLSDHTMGTIIPTAAVSLGACIVEKHLTLSRAVPGPDSSFSLEPQEFREMVTAIRTCEEAILGDSCQATEEEAKSLVFRRSLFVTQDLKAGARLTAENVRSIRPSHGLMPKHLKAVLGRQVKTDIEKGTPLSWEILD